MGYAVYEDRDALNIGVQRWAGYAVPGICDHPDCDEELALGRGLGNKCERTGKGKPGCGLYFCGKHLNLWCDRKLHNTFKPKPDTDEWINHILTDDSWQQWREENSERTVQMQARLYPDRKALEVAE